VFLLAIVLAAKADISYEVAVPVPWVSGECIDERFPKISGDWVVGCKGRGTITRAWNLRGRFGVQFEGMGTHPALSDGLIIDFEGGLVVDLNTELCLVPDGSACSAIPSQSLNTPIVGPYHMNGDSVSVTVREGVSFFTYGSNQRELLAANPSSWYPSAVGSGWLAWTEPSTESGVERGMFWSRQIVTPVEIGSREENVRHLTSSGSYLAWIEDSSVVIGRVIDGELATEAHVSSDAHTSSSLSLNNGIACWESWGEGVDIECSNGRSVGGDGHQRYPSHNDDWLIYRVDGVTMVEAFVVASDVNQQEANEPLD
jgi:hypothetical protein